MREISKINLKRMNNGAHFAFMKNILTRAEADKKISEKLAPIIAELKAAVEKEDDNLKISQKSQFTDAIAKADIDRGSFYNGYKRGVRMYLDFPDEAVAMAAKVLNQHLKDYSINPKMQLDRETGLLMNFLSDLEGRYTAEVELLSLKRLVTCMKEANDRVNRLMIQRTEEKMGIIVGIMKASRKVSDNVYNRLVKKVNALALIEGEEDYTDFIDYVNIKILRYKREVLGQKAGTTTPDDVEDNTDGGNEEGGSENIPGGV